MGDVGPVAAGVHAHAAADRSGDTDRPLQPGQPGLDALTGQGGQGHGTTGRHHRAIHVHCAEPGGVEHDCDPGEPGVGDEQVGAPPDDQQRQPRLRHRRPDGQQVLGSGGGHHDGGGAADPVGGEGSDRPAGDHPVAQGVQDRQGGRHRVAVGDGPGAAVRSLTGSLTVTASAWSRPTKRSGRRVRSPAPRVRHRSPGRRMARSAVSASVRPGA